MRTAAASVLLLFTLAACSTAPTPAADLAETAEDSTVSDSWDDLDAATDAATDSAADETAGTDAGADETAGKDAKDAVDIPDVHSPTCYELGCEQDATNPCAYKDCNWQSGLCEFVPITDACEDGNLCTGGSKCWDGACVGGTEISCDDGNVCTADSCDSTTGCVHLSLDGTPCNDGQACTLADACTSSACAGTPVDCDDGDGCTADTCVASVGGCSHVPIAGCATPCTGAAGCDDGNAATNDFCAGALCANYVPGSGCVLASECDDGKPCTKDVCVTSGGWIVGVCGHATVSGCCMSNDVTSVAAECGKPFCGTMSCDVAAHKCVKAESGVEGCCEDDAECVKFAVGCTPSSCIGNQCVSEAKAAGCCAKDSDCPVESQAGCKLPGTCNKVGGGVTGSCLYVMPGLCACWDDASCDDQDCATVDVCNKPGCVHWDVKGKCSKDSDCVDGNPCTVDTCGPPSSDCASIGACVHAVKSGCE